MKFPKEYIDFLVHFHGDRDYFECHEILEDYWKKVDSRNKESIWVGLIQFAVSNYHYRRGNFRGAIRTLEKSMGILSKHTKQLEKLGLHPTELFHQMEYQKVQMNHSRPYLSPKIPISHDLMELCKKRSLELGVNWNSPSNMEDLSLVHRHKKRDRSLVIKERQQALQNKKNKR